MPREFARRSTLTARRAPSRSRRSYRASLPANRCPFCKNETDVKHDCAECKTECFATCSKCVEMNAPRIRAPRKMVKVRTANKEEKKYVCFPHCARKSAYLCQHCNKWHDKTILHGFIRQNGNVNGSLCQPCAVKDELTICCSCHRLIRASTEYRDAQGFKCEGCFSRGNTFTPVRKRFEIITKKDSRVPKDKIRTYGLELEINDIHRKDELCKEIAKLNVEGVEFSIVGDGSVHHGFEVVSFPAERPLLNKATKVLCRVVRQYKHTFAGSGLHVHVADPKVEPHDAFRLWIAAELSMFAFLPRFRRYNDYSASIIDHYEGRRGGAEGLFEYIKDMEDALQVQSSRYRSMNLHAVSKHGTVEFRSHHATDDYRDIFHYLTFLDSFYRSAAKTWTKEEWTKLLNLSKKAQEKEPFAEALAMLHVPKPTIHYLDGRRDFYVKNPGVDERRLGVLEEYPNDNQARRSRRVFSVPPVRRTIVQNLAYQNARSGRVWLPATAEGQPVPTFDLAAADGIALGGTMPAEPPMPEAPMRLSENNLEDAATLYERMARAVAESAMREMNERMASVDVARGIFISEDNAPSTPSNS